MIRSKISVLFGFGGLILATGPVAAESKTAQQCYKEDSNWTRSCGALEGPQQVRDDCFRAGDTRLERCLDSVGKTASGRVVPRARDLSTMHSIEQAPARGSIER